ncbi:scm-like with four MBT domains protein 1 isoform X2 [Metopolophium dirhodum]|uniref:scm-like with four MBT domains protein 1 isoform X2 n=1 Tax=Metopolophium dirhodum TaxID=44670 RepID=UPI00298F6612|nr:scm-like with four MBT domains protein 1 isoform X2 [Metopolophium dirhodum]
MSSNSDDLFVEDKPFDWIKYLTVRNAEAVPKDFFHHICESEMNGIELGSVVEIENEDGSGYWFASVCLSKGAFINLHYFDDDNDKHNFWLKLNSSRLHSLNWGSENNKQLIPPHPERRSRLIPEDIKERVQNCEHAVSNTVLQMKGAPIHNIFKRNMFVEVQDTEYPYRVWISKVLKNVGGRLFLQIQGVKSTKKKSFWLFYLNERVFPLGWAEEKGLPWRVMNLDANLENSMDSSVLLNVLKKKIPEQHGYKVGEMLEIINPYSLMEFYVATIVKIYDRHYFKVEVNNEIDVKKRMSFVATKDNPYLFNAGWASKHKFLLQPPSDWKNPNKFSWSKYILMKNSKLASVDMNSRKNTNHVHIGMKLEAVDPLNTDSIRVATVQGFADHWMFLSFDSISCCLESLHVRSVYSDDVFPVGWCNKHKYSLSVPKLPHRDNQNVDDGWIESLKRKNIGDCEKGNSTISKTVNKKIDVIEPIFNVKAKAPELDEKLHDALFLDVKVDDIHENINTVNKCNSKKYKVNNIDTIIEYVVNNTSPKNSYKMCIYFNKDCYCGSHLIKKKIPTLPNSIGPGLVSSILQQAITILVDLAYFPSNALKIIKKNENKLLNGLGGVKILISTKGRRSQFRASEYLLIPGSKEMAGIYCSALCDLFGMCEFFVTTEDTKCPHSCNAKNDKIVAGCKNYLENVISSAHTIRLNQSNTELESLLIAKIITKKNILRRMDSMDIFSNTKSEVKTIEEKLFVENHF